MPTQKVAEQGSAETHRYEFVKQLNSRTGDYLNKDIDFENVIIETARDIQMMDIHKQVMKRSGTTQYLAPSASGQIRGLFYWVDQSLLMYCVGKEVFAYNVNTQVTTTLSYSSSNNIFTTTSGDVGFTEYLYANGTIDLIVTDGTTLYQVTNAFVLTPCTDVNMPVPHLPQPVFLDGYLNLVQANSGNVWNSESNNPLLWNASWFFTAEQQPSLINRLCVVNNYLVVFTTNSIQYWWDAANASGSPYQLNPTPIKMSQYLGGFAQKSNTVYFIGMGRSSQPSLFELKDFNIQEVGIPTVGRYLNYVTEQNQEQYTTWRGNIVSCQGHDFYLLAAGNYTYVCDLDHNYWTRWAFQGLTNFPMLFSTRVVSPTFNETVFAFKGTSSILYNMGDTLYQDNGINYTVSLVTEKLDFNTLNNKFMSRLSIVGDWPGATSYVTAQWTDNDYQTYNPSVQINLDQPLPTTRQLGMFRQRAFQFTYADNYPLRVTAIEMDINKGNR